jgi:arylsulfatase A-like enzyme
MAKARRPVRRTVAILALAAMTATGAAIGAAARADPAGVAPQVRRNVVIFVADGLRSAIVSPQTAPALAAVRDQGVDFRNSHSLYPTLTTPNASAIATGHRLGDTGDFGNVLYVGAPFGAPYGSPIAPVEDDVVLGLLNQRFGGDYLHETSLLQAAHAAGFETAVIGKLGPAAIQDVTARDGTGTIVIDDATGYPGGEGVALSADVARAIKAAGLAPMTPDRGLNGSPGTYDMPGVQVANVEQQDWFAAVATKVLLPRFKASGRPFVLVFWSRDPDGTQHNEGDSLNTLTPGINGPTTMAGIRNASNDLGALRQALAELGLAGDTDVFVTADHGFSVESRQSRTSAAARLRFPDVPPGFLPPGFLAIDLSRALGLGLYDPSGVPVDPAKGFYPRRGGSILATDPAKPRVVVVINGGSDLIYLPDETDRALAARVVAALTAEDYTGAIFVKDSLGPVPGALPTSAIGFSGTAVTPAPSIVVGFRNFSTGCANPEICGAEVADTELQQGQGIHGSFGRQDTHNFMAAIGPDFKAGFQDPEPVSNADVAPTLARLLGLDLGGSGAARGRVAAEALSRGAGSASPAQSHVMRSAPAANGFVTILDWQEAGGAPYFDAAGMPGRTIGLADPGPAR